jgi:dTDP-4-dehydrorhamnose 3,5-epimerase-like enzyme
MDNSEYAEDMKIPSVLSSMFNETHFASYPFVVIPQVFEDARGTILNIADGNFGDVAIIHSTKGSVRANHYHDNDWHFSYVVSGSMNYEWKNSVSDSTIQVVEVKGGQMVYSPPGVPHKMTFLEESIFVAVSGLSRDRENYEADTHRLAEDFF